MQSVAAGMTRGSSTPEAKIIPMGSANLKNMQGNMGTFMAITCPHLSVQECSCMPASSMRVFPPIGSDLGCAEMECAVRVRGEAAAAAEKRRGG